MTAAKAAEKEGPSRAQLLAKVEHAKQALALAHRDEREAKERVKTLAGQVDQGRARLREARAAGRESFALSQAADEAEAEYDDSKVRAQETRRNREEAAIALDEAEKERDRYIQEVELAEAPDKFEDVAGKLHVLLTGLAGAAIAAGLRGTNPTKLQAVGVIVAIIGSGIGLLAYAPQLLATWIDAVRARRGRSGKGSIRISWNRGIQVIRFAMLILLLLLVAAAWTLVLAAYFRTVRS